MNPMKCFQFLRIPPKGEPEYTKSLLLLFKSWCFQFLGIPPKGEHLETSPDSLNVGCFQFLGIPPKGELCKGGCYAHHTVWRFQFLGIPPKGEQ